MSFRFKSTFRSRPPVSPLSTPRLVLPPLEDEVPPSAKLRLYGLLAAMAVIGLSLGVCWLAIEALRLLGVIKVTP